MHIVGFFWLEGALQVKYTWGKLILLEYIKDYKQHFDWLLRPLLSSVHQQWLHSVPQSSPAVLSSHMVLVSWDSRPQGHRSPCDIPCHCGSVKKEGDKLKKHLHKRNLKLHS